MIVILILACGSMALYFLLLNFLPRYLHAEAVQRPLQWAYWGSGVLILVAFFVSCSSWERSIRYPTFFSLLVVGNGLLIGLLARVTVVSKGAWMLSRIQALLTPVLIPLLPWWIGFREHDVVYWDSNVSIELVMNPGMISEIATTQITIYQSQALLFEQRIGYIHATQTYPNSPKDGFNSEHFDSKQWWGDVRRVTVNDKFLEGVVQHASGQYPFEVDRKSCSACFR